jgi:hypothetical protein
MPLQRGAQSLIDAADGSEVQQAELAVGQQQHIARVRVGVEGAFQHDLAQQAVQQAAGQRGAYIRGRAGVDRGQRPPVEAFHHQYPLGAERLAGHRDPDSGRGTDAGRGGHRRHVALFHPQVELLAQGSGETLGEPGGADGPAPAGAALQPGREPPGDVQVPLHDLADLRPAHLYYDPVPGPERRRVHLGDRRRGQRLPVEADEQLTHLGAQLGSQHLLDRGPGDFGRVVLQPAQLADELGWEQIAAGGQHLPELDEGDPAVLQGQPHRASQPGPALRGGQLGPAPAMRIGQQSPPRQDPADLPVAARPAHPPTHPAHEVSRPGQRPARHQHLGDDQENHADHQRDDHSENHEPQGRQHAALVGECRAADHGRDDRREDQERDDAGRQRAQHRHAHPDQASHPEHEQHHRQGSRGGQQRPVHSRHGAIRPSPAPAGSPSEFSTSSSSEPETRRPPATPWRRGC